jgi:hypothetical protein
VKAIQASNQKVVQKSNARGEIAFRARRAD